MVSSDNIKLRTNNICKTFTRRTGATLEVLKDISLDIRDGEFIAIVGASGCGKTTFLRILDGLIEHSGGEIFLDGKKVSKPGPELGFVFQNDSLFPWRTVLDNVRFGLEVQKKGKKQSIEQAKKFIDLVGLSGFEHNYPYELSGGMRQRANLARALTVNPEVLLMDEPFASLDAQTREIMQAELLKIWNTEKKTVIFITHQIDEAVYLSDKVVVFTSRPGRVKEIIPIEIPRPRQLEVKRTEAFIKYTDKIWKMIEEEVRQGIGRRTFE